MPMGSVKQGRKNRLHRNRISVWDRNPRSRGGPGLSGQLVVLRAIRSKWRGQPAEQTLEFHTPTTHTILTAFSQLSSPLPCDPWGKTMNLPELCVPLPGWWWCHTCSSLSEIYLSNPLLRDATCLRRSSQTSVQPYHWASVRGHILGLFPQR